MDRRIPGLTEPVGHSRDGSRSEVFPAFQALLAGRILRDGPRT